MYYLTLLLSAVFAANYIDGRIEVRSIKSVKEDDLSIANIGSTGTGVKSEYVPIVNVTDRFGFTINNAQANAQGSDGSYGASHAHTFGVHVGLLRPGNNYTPLYHNSASFSNSHNSGPGAPNTWANANNNASPGSSGGQSSSGFDGGRGNAVANSYSVVHAIPLWDGTVLLSNFKNKTVTVNTTVQVGVLESSKNNKTHLEFPDNK